MNKRTHFARAYGLGLVLLALFALSLGGCGIAWYVGSRPAGFGGFSEDASVAPDAAPGQHRLGGVYDAGWQQGNGTFYLATCQNTDGGTPTTITVPTGSYVTMLSGVAGGGAGTITITPAGSSITDAQVNPPITVPANTPFTIGKPVLQGNPNELGVGTTIVFSGGIAQCAVALSYYGGP